MFCFDLKCLYIYIYIVCVCVCVCVCVVTLNQILATVEKSQTQNIYIQFGVYIIMPNVA